MYKDYFHLKEEPFNITPDPRFLYLTEQHREAMNHLKYGVSQRKGFICLTGEVGAGKTTLCRALLNEVGPNVHTALILNPMLSGTQLLRAIAEEFALKEKARDGLGYLSMLNRFLLKINGEGKDAVVIIDEAQNMPHETLELCRLLSNLETYTQKLLQIVLVGQPELRQRLAHPSLRQLAQRITVRYHLGTMSPSDTAHYIRHRIRLASGSAEPPTIEFDAGAMEEIHQCSGGTPRLINSIGDKALLAGYVYRTAHIDRRLVQLAASELKEAC